MILLVAASARFVMYNKPPSKFTQPFAQVYLSIWPYIAGAMYALALGDAGRQWLASEDETQVTHDRVNLLILVSARACCAL